MYTHTLPQTFLLLQNIFTPIALQPSLELVKIHTRQQHSTINIETTTNRHTNTIHWTRAGTSGAHKTNTIRRNNNLIEIVQNTRVLLQLAGENRKYTIQETQCLEDIIMRTTHHSNWNVVHTMGS